MVVVTAMWVGVHAAMAQPAQGLGVAVVDFYAPSPLPPVEGLIPQERAADLLATLLAQSAEPVVFVRSRESVRQAEAALGWKATDVLQFARLQQLARAVNADRLLIGRIERLGLGGGGGQNAGGGQQKSGFASVTVQIFDARQGRIIFQAQASAYDGGVNLGKTAERLLRDVLERVLPSVLPVLTRPGP